MAKIRLNNFIKGLNTSAHPTQIGESFLQDVENMEVQLDVIDGTTNLTYLALTARGSYKRLHTDDILATHNFTPYGIFEFIKRNSAGNIPVGTPLMVVAGKGGSGLHFAYMKRGDTTLTQNFTSGGTTVDNKQVFFFTYGDALYFNGLETVWYKWLGSDLTAPAPSGFTTKTLVATVHKQRVFYGNDITNGKPNRIWVSDVGDPETVGASNFFDIGSDDDPIIALLDQVERVLIIKENSTWAFYLAPTLSDSTILRADEWKGAESSHGAIWASYGTFVYTKDSGIQFVRGLRYEAFIQQIYNYAKRLNPWRSSMAIWSDKLYIAARKEQDFQIPNNETLVYDFNVQGVFKHTWPLHSYCPNRGLRFAPTGTRETRLKALEVDTTTSKYFIVELYPTPSDSQETTISCKMKTGALHFGDTSRKKILNWLVLEFNAPDTTTPVALNIYVNNNTIPAQTLTFTPTATGFQRKRFDPIIPSVSGHYLTFEVTYNQNAQLNDRFTILSLEVDVDLEERIE